MHSLEPELQMRSNILDEGKTETTVEEEAI